MPAIRCTKKLPAAIALLIVAAVLVTLSVAAPGASAAPAAPPIQPAGDGTDPVTARPEAATLTPAIESLRAGLDGAAGLEEPAKAAVRERLDAAAASLQIAAELRAQAEQFRERAAAAPAERDAIRDELNRPPEEISIRVPEGATVSDLEQKLGNATAELTAARAQVAELQAEATRRVERRSVIPDQLADAAEQLATLRTSSVPPSPDAGLLAEAKYLADQAQRVQLRTKIETLEAEQASYEARRDLLPARRDRALRRVAQAEKLVAAWQGAVSARREAAAKAARNEAAELLERAQAHPVLAAYARENRGLAERRTGSSAEDPGLIRQIDATNASLRDAEAGMAELRRKYQRIKTRVEAIGLNRTTGLLLRKQYDQLPSPERLGRRLREAREALEAIEYDRIDWQEQRAGVGVTEAVVNELMAEVEAGESGELSTEERDRLREVAGELVSSRRALLDTLVEDANKQFEALVALGDELDTYRTAAARYEAYIEERILWVRSIAGEDFPTLREARRMLNAVADPNAWRAAAAATWRNNGDGRVLVPAAGLVIIAAFVLAGRARKRVTHLTELASRFRTDKFVYSLQATVLTLISALPVPLMLWIIGWLLTRPVDANLHAVATGTGFTAMGTVAYALTFWRRAVRPRGLAETHLRWPAETTAHVRTSLRWLAAVLVPMVGLYTAIEQLDSVKASMTIGRAAFTLALLAMLIFFLRVLRPGGEAMSEFLERNPTGIVARSRMIWYPLLLIVPAGLILIAWLGWYYTAMQLETRFEQSIGLLLVLLVGQGLLTRWLFVARRKVAVENSRRKREQAIAESKKAAEQSAEDDDAAGGEAQLPPIDPDTLDLPAISAQTRQLFNAATAVTVVVGLYLIWASVLPALRMLDRIEIYPDPRIVAVENDGGIPELDAVSRAVNPGAAGAAAVPEAERQAGSATGGQSGPGQSGSGQSGSTMTLPGMPSLGTPAANDAGAEPPPADDAVTVSLADVGVAVLILIATVLAFRNVPGLAEIVILQRLPLDAGSRYALYTVMRYAIAIVGVLIAFNAVNLAWSKVQWLAAAFTFGLAFGLQEIFANFVSGLIILAERPVRIGDTVTVGSTTGRITRIRMRATTIIDWDRKELIIPNKNFITNDVINWTLSDPVLRVIIPVGVAYGADVDLATKTLYEVADKHKVVLAEPAPHVLFNGFGDSTLNFELRIFIPHVDHFIRIRHSLHMDIIKAFRAAGIEIAFPQRDLYIKSMPEMNLVQRRADLPPEEGGPGGAQSG